MSTKRAEHGIHRVSYTVCVRLLFTCSTICGFFSTSTIARGCAARWAVGAVKFAATWRRRAGHADVHVARGNDAQIHGDARGDGHARRQRRLLAADGADAAR